MCKILIVKIFGIVIATFVLNACSKTNEEYSPKQLKETILQLEGEMRQSAKDMKFEHAAGLRDKIKYLRERELQLS